MKATALQARRSSVRNNTRRAVHSRSCQGRQPGLKPFEILRIHAPCARHRGRFVWRDASSSPSELALGPLHPRVRLVVKRQPHLELAPGLDCVPLSPVCLPSLRASRHDGTVNGRGFFDWSEILTRDRSTRRQRCSIFRTASHRLRSRPFLSQACVRLCPTPTLSYPEPNGDRASDF